MILTLGSEKGGVGKTVIAVHLAYMRAATGREVCLVDADPQWSSSDFCAARDVYRSEQVEAAGQDRESRGTIARISSVQKTGRGIGEQLRALSQKYDDLIIDTGGRDSVELRTAVLVSDMLLIPMNCSALNWWTLDKMDKLVEEARLQNPTLRAEISLNRLPALPSHKNSKVNRGVDRIHNAEYQSLSMLTTVLVERDAYSINEEFGLTVFETSPLRPKVDAKAISEITALYEEIFGEQYNETQRAPAA